MFKAISDNSGVYRLFTVEILRISSNCGKIFLPGAVQFISHKEGVSLMGSTLQVHFWGPINIQTAEVFRNMLINATANPDVSGIEILMSSEGGDLNSGFTMYNYLRSFPLKTSIVNMGTIESIALLPFLGADERRAVPDSRFLIHNFTWTFPNTPTDINRVAERSQSLGADVDRFVSIYNDRTAGAKDPIDVRNHLTGPAAIIGNAAGVNAGILTTDDSRFPVLNKNAFFDRIFK